MESYQGDQRIRYFALKVQPRVGNHGKRLLLSENKALLDRLSLYDELPDKDQYAAKGNEMYDEYEQADNKKWNPFGNTSGGYDGGYM